MADIDDVRAELEKAELERDQAREATEKAENASKALEARITELEKAAPEAKPDPVEIDKADLPEPVRLMLEKAEADAADTRKRLEKAEADATRADEVAKAERDLRIEREFVAKAEKEFPYLKGTAEEKGARLKRKSELLTKDEFESELEDMRANNALAKSAFAEIGRGGEPQPGSPQGGLVAKKDEIRKSDPSISDADALQRALRENPDLAGQYLAAQYDVPPVR